jgi:predicted amidohydrolase
LTTFNKLLALQFDYQQKSFEENFKTLQRLLKQAPSSSVVLAPELCLGGYKYDSLDLAATFSQEIIPSLKELSNDKIFALTLIEKEGKNYYNNLKIFFNKQLIYSRPKARLFPLGDEERYFTAGKDEDINIIEIDGIKIATLICFELRFTELWQKVLGADIILVPALWGKTRKEHLKTLSHALAIANQAFVLVANSSDSDMASSSGIITPFGDVYRDDSSFIIHKEVDFNEIKKMRRYINIGLA